MTDDDDGRRDQMTVATAGDTDTTSDDAVRLVALPPTAAIRRPDHVDHPDHDTIDRLLAQANRADQDYSRHMLRGLFPELPTAGEPPPGRWAVDRDQLSRLFDMAALDSLIGHGTDSSRIAFSNWAFLGDITGSSLNGTERIHGAIAGRAVSDGGRLLLRNIDRDVPGLRQLAIHLGRLCRAQVDISVTIGAGGFSGETDSIITPDRLVIPVTGHRRIVATDPSGTPLHTGSLGPGEALLVPAGASVATTALNEIFVHLEVRITQPTPANVLPLIGAVPPQPPVAWADLGPPLEEQLLTRWCVDLPTRPQTPFSTLLGERERDRFAHGWMRPSFTGGWCRVVTDETHPTIAAAGIGLRVPGPLVPVLAQSLCGPPRRVADVRAQWPSALRLIDLLIESGLYEFWADSTPAAAGRHGPQRNESSQAGAQNRASGDATIGDRDGAV